MDDNAIKVLQDALGAVGGKLTLEQQNRVTITRPAQSEKVTKDVQVAAVMGVEVSAYGATAADAAASAIESFLDACRRVDTAFDNA